jgi:hypothetical protein
MQFPTQRGHVILFDDGVARAFHAAEHPERAQQMAHKRRLASAERPTQFDEGIAQALVACHCACACGAVGFIRPGHAAGS